jgi:hypothetical protein
MKQLDCLNHRMRLAGRELSASECSRLDGGKFIGSVVDGTFGANIKTARYSALKVNTEMVLL